MCFPATMRSRLLLIEEPETGIHARRAAVVVNLLRKLSEGVDGLPPTQVIVTTHSPYVLDFLKPEEVLLLRKDADGAAVASRMADVPLLDERLQEQFLGEL